MVEQIRSASACSAKTRSNKFMTCCQNIWSKRTLSPPMTPFTSKDPFQMKDYFHLKRPLLNVRPLSPQRPFSSKGALLPLQTPFKWRTLLSSKTHFKSKTPYTSKDPFQMKSPFVLQRLLSKDKLLLIEGPLSPPMTPLKWSNIPHERIAYLPVSVTKFFNWNNHRSHTRK